MHCKSKRQKLMEKEHVIFSCENAEGSHAFTKRFANILYQKPQPKYLFSYIRRNH